MILGNLLPFQLKDGVGKMYHPKEESLVFHDKIVGMNSAIPKVWKP